MPTAYCFKCRATREIANPKVLPTAKGGRRIAGRCQVCNGQLSKLASKQE